MHPSLLSQLAGGRRVARARSRGRFVALALAASALATSAPPPAGAQGSLAPQLEHEMTIAGPYSGAYVYDLTTATPLFSERATNPHPPASVEKLYTATTALELMGPEASLATTVLGSGHLGPGGRWEGNLYLHGGGDPTFGSAPFVSSHYGGRGTTVSRLAGLVKAAGVRS